MLQSSRGQGRAQHHKEFTERAASSCDRRPSHPVFFRDDVYRALLRSTARVGEASVWANLFRGRRCRWSRRCSPCPLGTVTAPAAPGPGNLHASAPPVGTGAPRKLISAAQRARPRRLLCCVILRERAALLPTPGPWMETSATAVHETPEGHRYRRRQERTCPLAWGREMSPVLCSEMRLKSNIHFPIMCFFFPSLKRRG